MQENEDILDEFFKDDEYEIEVALSYSRTSDFDRNGAKALIKKSSLNSEAASLGSITDDFLNSNINVYDKYCVYDGKKPTATLGKLVDIVLNNYTKLPTKKQVYKIVKENSFWSTTKNEELLTANFDTPEFWDYIKVQYKNKHKKFVTSDVFLLGQELANIVKTHKFTSYIFSDTYQRLDQFEFRLTYKGIVFRGFIDFVLIDRKNKTVQIIDLKTGKETADNFLVSFLKYRYYLQEAVYMKAFKIICNKLNLKGYNLLPFQFLYVSKYEKVPLFFTMTKKWHNAALKGFTTSTGYTYRGLEELAEDMKWHYQNNIFDASRNVYEANGTIDLNDKFITVNG